MAGIVYIASPIDKANRAAREAIRAEIEEVREALVSRGFTTFVPLDAWRTERPAAGIQEANNAVLEQAVGLVVAGLAHAPTVGTFFEIGLMRGLGRPVVFYKTKPESVVFRQFWVLEHPGAVADHLARYVQNQAEIGYYEEASGFEPPRRAYPGDAGFDIATAEDYTVTPLKPGDPAHRIPLAHRLFPPAGYWFFLAERSSTRDRWGVEIIPGVMDGGYTGPWFARTVLRREEPVTIPKGTRLVQAIPIPIALDKVPLVKHDKPPIRVRGEAGFGSSDGGK